ncbi:MAG TPA: hypothetical protein VGD16_00990 [Enterovirga sp.]|jgi:hypothetical protein
MTDTPHVSQDPAELLRAAVTAAKETPAADTLAKPQQTGMASAAPVGPAAKAFRRYDPAKLRVPAIAAGLVLAAGLGYGAARLAPAAEPPAELRWSEAAAGLRQSHEDLAQMMSELRHLKLAVDGAKTERDRTRADLSKQAQFGERLDRLANDSAARLGKLVEQVDRIEKTQRDPARLQPFAERLDRIEKQIQLVADKMTAKPVAAMVVPDVTQTGSLAETRPAAAKAADKAPDLDPRKTPLEGYVLRDVSDGFALVEAKNGRMIEVQTGQMLGAGNRVEAIERRGRQWVVVTSKGFVGERWP